LHRNGTLKVTDYTAVAINSKGLAVIGTLAGIEPVSPRRANFSELPPYRVYLRGYESQWSAKVGTPPCPSNRGKFFPRVQMGFALGRYHLHRHNGSSDTLGHFYRTFAEGFVLLIWQIRPIRTTACVADTRDFHSRRFKNTKKIEHAYRSLAVADYQYNTATTIKEAIEARVQHLRFESYLRLVTGVTIKKGDLQ